MAELKEEFKKRYGLSYEDYTPENRVAEITGVERNKQQLASRINLGESLLKTVENMKAAGISEQQLTIEC